MTQTSSKAALLARIDEERGLWEQIVARIGAAQMAQPGATGDWSFKDVVAHLNGWRINTLLRLEAAQAGRTPTPPPWPAQLNEDDDVDQINAWIYQANRDRPLPEVLDDYQQSFQRMHTAVAALPDEALTNTTRYPWTDGLSLAQVVEASFGHFHEEHEPTLRDWLAQLEAAPSRERETPADRV